MKQDVYKMKSWIISVLLGILTSINVMAQTISDSCFIVPEDAGLLVRIHKTTGQETLIGPLGVFKVQAISFNGTGDILYAANNVRMGTININTGAFTPMSEDYGTGSGVRGTITFINLDGLAYDVFTDFIFGAVRVSSEDLLIRIDPETGAHIPDAFGPGLDYVPITGVFPKVDDLAVSPIDGKLYGVSRRNLGGDVVITIDKATGEGTIVGPMGIDIVESLGFDNDGNGYATTGNDTSTPNRFFAVDVSTGATTEIAELMIADDYESCSCTTLSQVTEGNNDPVTQDDEYTALLDETLTIDPPGVLGNDSDPDGDDLTVTLADAISDQGGTVEVDENGGFTYTPPAGFTGTDTFTYTVSDGNGGTDSATVTIEVTDGSGGNNNPLAQDDEYNTEQDIPLTVSPPGVLANDSDVDGDDLTISAFDAVSASGGTVELDGDGGFTYTPPAGFTGTDSFTYTVSDGNGGTDTATVTIEVDGGSGGNAEPTAQDDEYSTEQDVPLTVSAPGVLSNDSDGDGDDLTVSEFDGTSAEGGTVEMNADGSFTYTPPAGFTGTDSFTYTVSDGNGGTDIATVTVTVTAPNSDPSAQDDEYSTEQDVPLTVSAPGVLANDSDPEGDDLTVSAFDGTSAEGGTVEMNADGSFTYTPPAGFTGTDSFTYTVSDGNGGTDIATVTVTVTAPNSDPSAQDDEYSTEQDVPLTVSAPGVLANDSDPEGDDLTVSAFDASSVEGGTVAMNADGSFTYTPPAGFTGTDSFTYTVSDGNGGTDTATVTIIIANPNTNPDAVDDEYETDIDVVLTVEVPGVLINDTDPEGDELMVIEFDAIGTAGGTIEMNEDGSFTYTPPPGFTGTDTFSYTISDGNGGTDTATVTILVNDVPLRIYNAFSPNSDGVNDVWVIEGITQFPNNTVKIYNRWGNLVYQVRGYDNTAHVWQGQSTEGIILGDKQVPDGSYFYLLDLGDGSELLNGFVVIHR